MGSIEPVDDPSEDYAAIMAPTLIGDDFSSLVSSWVPSRRFGKTWTRWRYAASMTIDRVEYAPGFSTDFPSDPFETSEWPANYRAHVGNDFYYAGEPRSNCILRKPSYGPCKYHWY